MSYTWPLGEAESKLQFFDLSHPGATTRRCGRTSRTSRSSGSTTMARSPACSRSRSRRSCTARTHTDAPAHVIEGTPLHRRGAAECLLRHRRRRLDPEGQVGGDHRRGPGERHARRSAPATSSSSTPAGTTTTATTREYFVESPGFYKEAGEWFAAKGVKGFGID